MPNTTLAGLGGGKAGPGKAASVKSVSSSTKSGGHRVNLDKGRAGFIATGPKLLKTKSKTSFPVRRRHLDPEERKKLARLRWKKAIRKVKAMLKWHIKFDDDEESKTPVNLAPTYKMEPDPGKKFNSSRVERLLESLLNERLAEYEYSRFTGPKFAKVLSGVINDRLKELDFPRYKFITNVLMTENTAQGVDFTSRCVWDARTDRHASATYRTAGFICIALVHAVYLE